jgi:hypothetical protein
MKPRLRSIARSIAQLPGGRRTKFAVVGVSVVIAVAIAPLSERFEDAQKNDPVEGDSPAHLSGDQSGVDAAPSVDDKPMGANK